MFEAGQSWTYRAPPELENSRIVIGALLAFDADRKLACCTIRGARQRRPDGSYEQVDIPFVPMTVEALAETVVALDGNGEVDGDFIRHFEAWNGDGRGLSYFTVPFEGSLDVMIARQMEMLVDGREA